MASRSTPRYNIIGRPNGAADDGNNALLTGTHPGTHRQLYNGVTLCRFLGTIVG